MVFPCGLQENTLVQGEASPGHKQVLWLHHDAMVWTPGRDSPSSATRQLQKHLSYVHGAVPIPCSRHRLDRDTKTLSGRGELSPLTGCLWGGVGARTEVAAVPFCASVV